MKKFNLFSVFGFACFFRRNSRSNSMLHACKSAEEVSNNMTDYIKTIKDQKTDDSEYTDHTNKLAYYLLDLKAKVEKMNPSRFISC
jgi:hypothetical protein